MGLTSRPWVSWRLVLDGRGAVHALAGLQDGFQAAQDPHPSGSGDAGRGLRGGVELVVENGEQGDAVLAGFDQPSDPTGWLGGQFGVVQAAVGNDQAVGWLGVQDRVVAHSCERSGE
jgi:hypothetical protein